MRPLENKRGIALLEVLLAMAILGIVSTAVLTEVQAAHAGLERAITEEQRLERMNRILTVTVLMRREELDRRIGTHQAGDALVRVSRPQRGLYRISVAELDAPAVETLVTVIHRE